MIVKTSLTFMIWRFLQNCRQMKSFVGHVNFTGFSLKCLEIQLICFGNFQIYQELIKVEDYFLTPI